jgi:hypothetical protein
VESKPETDPLITLIQWTLDRILNHEYKVTRDSDGKPEWLEVDPDYVSVETIEEDLIAVLPWENLEKLFALRNERTPAQVGVALAKIPMLKFYLGTEAFEKLFRAEWAEIVSSVYWGLRRGGDALFRAVISSRIGLGGPDAASLETGMQLLRPHALPEAAAEYAIREMCKLLPDVVERLRRFQVTPVTSAVPTNVAQYAREASRCYLYGFFSAALILCRSCVESGIEGKLIQNGLRKQLNAIAYNKVQAMLDLARDSGVLDEITYGMANDIRKSANKAVHGAVPIAKDCRERLEQTRALLRHLYE